MILLSVRKSESASIISLQTPDTRRSRTSDLIQGSSSCSNLESSGSFTRYCSPADVSIMDMRIFPETSHRVSRKAAGGGVFRRGPSRSKLYSGILFRCFFFFIICSFLFFADTIFVFHYIKSVCGQIVYNLYTIYRCMQTKCIRSLPH